MGIDLSEKITINHGVPQGTVLGPFIFLLYVYDFSEKPEGEADVVQYADDTSIICKLKCNKIILQKIEQNIRTNRQITDRKSTHF